MPPVKREKTSGERKHPVNQGQVGLNIGTQTVGIASGSCVRLEELAAGIDNSEAGVRRLQRESGSEPPGSSLDNYNADGTVKKGRLSWVRSKCYMKILFRLKELWRVLTARKNELHNQLANFILSLGDEVYVEDMNFMALAKRAKKTKKNTKGKFKRKRFGKSILRKSPALPLRINDRKFRYKGKELLKVDLVAKSQPVWPYRRQLQEKTSSQAVTISVRAAWARCSGTCIRHSC